MPRHTLGWRHGRSLPDHALRFQKRIESKPAASSGSLSKLPLVPKFVATLELNDDKVRIAGNIFRKSTHISNDPASYT